MDLAGEFAGQSVCTCKSYDKFVMTAIACWCPILLIPVLSSHHHLIILERGHVGMMEKQMYSAPVNIYMNLAKSAPVPIPPPPQVAQAIFIDNVLLLRERAPYNR